MSVCLGPGLSLVGLTVSLVIVLAERTSHSVDGIHVEDGEEIDDETTERMCDQQLNPQHKLVTSTHYRLPQ